jgi:predicted MFS family arabinose efflux permease
MLKKYRWAVLGVLLFIEIIAYVDRNLINAFAPQITAELGLSDTRFGFLSGVVWVLSFGIMAVFMGSLADRFGRPRIIAAGVFVWSVCTAASGLAENFMQMTVARFFVATGEAALVPAATALFAEIFDSRQRSTVNGVFFTGLPLGLGLSFVISGTVGATIGWRSTYIVLGLIGVVISIALAFIHEEREQHPDEIGEPFLRQVRAMLLELAHRPVVVMVIAGFVFVHFVFAEYSFLQLWLVRERHADAAQIAERIGWLQIVFGTLGALIGGVAGDRLSLRFRGGHATYPVLALLVCVPLMVASRVAELGSPLFYAGLAASFFLPLSMYGSTLALIHGRMPVSMRSTTVGFTMMSLNVMAIAAGNLAAGAASDYMTAQGHPAPLTTVLIVMDCVLAVAFVFYFAAGRLIARERCRSPLGSEDAIESIG